MPDNVEALLRALVSVTSRMAFPARVLADIVVSGGASQKQVRAFNLCDGSMSQGEIAKALRLDAGNFSRTVSRWIDAGIVFRQVAGRDAKLLHVYALSEEAVKARRREKEQQP